MYNTAFMKIIVMIMVTILLNILCIQGLGVISWIIVFIPFILMTVMVSILLYIFGLDASTGKLKYTCDNDNNNEENIIKHNSNGDILIYDPEYNAKKNPVYYNSPNIVVPNPLANDYVSHN
jgi:c-di-AMP phosphodiesterase-like protein